MNIYLRRAIFILIIMILVVTYLTVTLYRRETIPGFNENKAEVVIDPGHGEPDGGAVGVSGAVEAEINLKIAQKLSAKLKEKCYNIVMTRTSDRGIFSEGTTIRQKKVSDMHNREKLMNSESADIFVSIHMNKFPDPSCHGAQVFYSQNSEESARLANCIQNALLSADSENKRVPKAAENSIYLMKTAKIPAVIVECGFISNPEEEQRLGTDEYREKLADAIAVGIEEFFEKEVTNEG